MPKIGDFVESYCCVCERLTTHEWIDDDEYLEFALLCKTCNIAWEAMDPSTLIDVDGKLD